MEKVVCKWWKLAHSRLPPKYNGSYYQTSVECTKPIWCRYNTEDAKMGGCKLRGDITAIPEEEKP